MMYKASLLLFVLGAFLLPLASAQNCSNITTSFCDSFNRQPCANTDFTCGSCKDHFLATPPSLTTQDSNTLCLADCSGAPNCTALFRNPCNTSDVFPNTCGACLVDFVGPNSANSTCKASCVSTPNCASLFRAPCNENSTYPNTCGLCKYGYQDSNNITTPRNAKCQATCFSSFNCDSAFRESCATQSTRENALPDTCGNCIKNYGGAAGPSNTTCEDLNPCKFNDDDFTSKIYNQYNYPTNPVCISLNTVKKTAFFVRVDDFSLLHLQRSWNQSFLNLSGSSPPLQIQIGNIVSPKKHFAWFSRELATRYVIPFATAIVELDNGRIQRIYWDEGCFTCQQDREACYEEICGVPYSDCQSGSVDCDIKIYLAWSGTDSNGRYLLSSGKVLSRFSRYSVKAAWDNAARTAEETYPQFSSSSERI